MKSEQAVESRWPAVLKLLGPKRKVTALLRDARVAAVQADDITLEFDYAFHAEQVEKPENRLVTEEALQQVYGRPLHARIVVKGATERSTVAAGIKEPEEQHDTLDWADVEAWVKTHDKKLKPYQNSYGGYNIDCPIPTHQLKDQRLSIRPMKDGNVFLKCFGGCNHQDVRAAIAKEINTPPNTEDTEPLDQLIDERLANEQTAEYWEDQATDAKAELEREREARLAAEKERDQARDDAKEVETLREEKSRLEKQRDDAEEERDKAYDAREAAKAELENRANSEITVGQLQKSVNELSDKKTRLNKALEKLRDEKEEEVRKLQTRLDAAEEERGQRDQRISDLEPKALTFDFIAAWGRLEDALKQLKSEMLQGKKHQIDARKELPIRLQLRLASDKGYISKDQYTNLESMKVLRDAIAHDGLPLTSGQVHGNLPILDDIITQLHQRSPRTSS